ncbi:hypothetical protein IEQ11_01005 [Lysobacter capsici]|jgi:hypothetical protein|uniref:Uncharacterized protein n=1 Tax=Lysobacter capsici AZ78 TaxID=1444315 RepID=A0A125MN23_9GAMM|nr:hypothetical protein [Lysobacter capsici]ALN83544.1 hypothetical protein LC55x_0239 [Lysobacter capsici]ATE70077.1 hypothetical protein CNO08_00985 [Lysobacter capsici]KWS05226.1 hypothetical protein AZ78_2777 [Lysobacter capsici AZ78]UOF15274.1 hypothetical protein IEQ11_01005 [Lysobacter capsici]WND80981.1 hypothetical protein RJ610_00980 [Lysobacter capsici]
MIEAIQVAAEAAQPAAASPAQSPQASAYDIREFAAAFDRGASPTSAGAQAGAPAQAAPTEMSQGTRAVLAALDNLNGGADKIDAATKTMSANSADLTSGEMIQMTMRCHQFMFTSQLTSNVANRTSDGIQQLFRQQS